MGTKLTNIAFRTALIYVILAGLWILFSDRAVLSFSSDPDVYVRMSTYKGWAFVIVTGTLLYSTLRAQLRRLHAELDRRKKAEQDLRQNQERLQLVIDNSEDVLIMQDIEGRYMHYSGPRQFGVSASDLIGKFPMDIHAPETAALIQNRHQKVVNTGESVAEDDAIRWNDHPLWFSTRVSPVRNDEGVITATVTVSHNITARKHVEEELIRSEERLHLAMEGTNDGLWDWSVGRDEVYFSPRWKSMLGYSDDELPNRYATWQSLLHPDDRDATEHSIRGAIETRSKQFEIEFRMRHKDGHYRHILSRGRLLKDERGDPVRFVGTHVDITDRKRAEEAIRASEERFRSFIEQAPLAVFVVNREGQYIDANPAAGTMLGYAHSELLGKRVGEFTTDEDRAAVAGSFAQLLETGRTEDEYRMVRKDGEKIWVSIVAVALDGDRFLAYCRDVTPRRHAEEQIKASLREKEVLLKEVHHRVKNNLQVVSSLISLQAEELKDADARAAFRESRQRVRSMALIHENLYRSENLASVRIKEYVDTVTKELRRSYSKAGVTIAVDVEPILMEIDAAIPCGLIINELLSNAFKHAFPDDREGTISLTLRRANPSTIRLVVEDNGVGFPKDMDYRNLSSMGMMLVISLSQQLSGEISLDNTRGTKLTLEFPG